MTRSGIKIAKASFAALYAMILAPGTYIVKAGTSNRIFDENLKKHKWITNLKAVAAHKIDSVKEAFAGKEEVEIEDLNGLTMSANTIENEGQTIELPIKNSDVKVIVDYVTNKKGERMLAVTGMSVTPAARPKTFSFDDSEDESNQSLSATSEAPEKKKETVKSNF